VRHREIQTLHYPEELESILRSVAGAARLAIEETGSNMLYLVLGFLDWYESDDSEQVRSAPLLLFPISLERGMPDARDSVFRYRVRHSGEDVFANLCLQEKLRQDFGLSLPDLDSDETPEAYFERVARLVSRRERWAVRRQASITLLSFGKMLMYRDLDSSNWPRSGGPANHPRVREFFEGRRHESVPVAGDYRIDEVEARAALPVLIDDADSSQHSVLIDARRGQNLVVMGPPGTGKSQTITNLIAAAISEGKRVLFVSEKLAALEVVRHRLDRAGLGIFCLELHSHKTQKKALIDDLRTRLNVRGRFQRPALLDEKLATLKFHKRDLGAYVELIGRRFGGLGQTVHEVLWAARRRRSVLPEPSARLLDDLRYTGAETVTLAGFERIRAQFSDFAAHLADVKGDHHDVTLHPWYGISAADLTFREERNLTEPLAEVQAAASELHAGADEFESSGTIVERTAAGVEGIVAGVANITTPVEEVIPEILQPLADITVRVKLERFCGLVRTYRTLHDRVISALGQVPPLSLTDAQALASAVSRDAQALPGADEIGTLRARVADVRELAADLRQAGVAVMAIDRALESSPVACGRTLPLIMAVLRAAAKTPIEALGYRDTQLRHDRAVALLEAAERTAEPIRAERTALAARLVLDLAPSLAAARRYAAAAANARWWKPWDREWRVARSALATMSRENGKATPSRAKADFQALAVYLEKVRAFEADSLHREVASQAFRGIDTPFSELAALAAWFQTLQGQLAHDRVDGANLVEALWSAPSEQLRTLKSEAAGGQRAIENASSAIHAISTELHAEHQPRPGEPLDAVADRLDALSSRCEDTIRTVAALGLAEQTPLDYAVTILERVVELRETAMAAMEDPVVSELLGRHFAGTDTNVERVFRTFVFADEVRNSTLPESLQRWLLDGEARQRTHELKEWAGRMRTALAALAAAWNTFSGTGAVDARTWFGEDSPALQAITKRGERALAARHLLPQWLDYQHARKTANDARLGTILVLAERGEIPPAQATAAFEYVFTHSLVQSVFHEYPGLARFSGLSHQEARNRFAALDRETIALERQRIAALIDSKPVPYGNDWGPVSQRTELALIQRETEKQTRHVPIRQLVRRAGAALQVLKPCFMMGPLSVAQYLEPDALEFDLVVMDEASQLRPEDALGSICRAKQVVVVGDPMQLPPTSFFDRIGDSEEEVNEDDLAQGLVDSESILDIARSVYRPTRMLRWHYRSQHADLIAFSNREFYDDELVVFPSPVTRSRELGIRFVHVPSGRFEARRNVAEAQKVVEAVLRHAREHPDDSLGVVTLNLNQREAIENELEQRLKDEPALRAFVDRHRETLQPLFVKNLENVQGDERDVIFVSVTYGPDRHGSVFQRFGPINGPMGHRRLNVLFTRAKRRVVVFSSLLAEQIRVGADSSRGVRALKGYLQFAQSGILELAQPTGRAPDSDFEVEVARALRSQGYEVVAQVGVSGFYIDLAVKHPSMPDRYLIGIECDGATYHSSRSARDRDRLREEILKGLGWDIARIWSTDWFRAPDVEIGRIVARLETMLAKEKSRAVICCVEDEEDEPVGLPEAQVFDLTLEQARALLVELRESRIRPAAPDSSLQACILRDVMVDALLRYRPLDRTEWQDRIPLNLRLDTEPEQTRYLDEIFSVISRVS
jgi:very-short-patch-repair endonuclease